MDARHDRPGDRRVSDRGMDPLGGDFAADEGFTAIVVLSAAMLAVGLAAIFVAARSIADPVAVMRSQAGSGRGR